MRSLMKAFLALGAIGLVGCGGASSVLNEFDPAPLETGDDVRFASGASAPQVYFGSFVMVIVPMELLSSDPACPVETVDGSVTTYTGGCTDTDGTTWEGTLRVTDLNETSGSGSFVFTDFSVQMTGTCGGADAEQSMAWNGTATYTANSAGDRMDFDLDLRVDQGGPDTDCTPISETLAWRYTGSYEESGSAMTWNGSGRFGTQSQGVVEASTQDEVTDSGTCSNTEALSGTTTLKTGGDTAVITYDGATDCNPASTVTWTLNGTAQGELSGVSCSAAGGGAGALWLGLVSLLTLTRRRREQRG